LHREKIDAYFKDNFKILIKDKELKYVNESIKRNDEAVWFYYKIETKKELRRFVIRNSLMLDLYPDQKNLLIMKKGKIERGYSFTIKKKEFTINVDEY